MKNFKFILIVSMFCLILSIPVLAAGDKVEFGSDIYVPHNQTISGDTVTIFGEQRIEGQINGSAVSIFGDITLDGGAVMGDAVSVFGEVIMQDKSVVRGDLVSVLGGVRRMGVTSVSGDIVDVGPRTVFNQFSRFVPYNLYYKLTSWKTSSWLSNAILSILITLVIIRFLLPNLDNIQRAITNEPVKIWFIGLVGSVIAYILIALIGITIIGIPVAMGLGLALSVAGYVGEAAIYLFVGSRLIPHLKIDDPTPYVIGAIGSLTFSLIKIIPFGGLINFMIGFLALGGVLVTKFGTNRKWIR